MTLVCNNIDTQNIDIEIPLLLEAIFIKYGYDFRTYSKSHIKRRLIHRLNSDDLSTISLMQNKLLTDKEYFVSLLDDLSINVTEMFRDPDFFLEFREKVVPILKTYPFIKIWHAGCSTGEEVYSLAIIMKEEKLLDRCQIYATDFNGKVLDIAKKGIYSNNHIELFAKNYKKSGGKLELSDYYTSKYGSVVFDKSLSKRVVFAEHNLVTDSVFAEVNLIFCRNVLIYFNKSLQTKVINLFGESLSPSGFLCLGNRESLKFITTKENYTEVSQSQKIFKKHLR